MRPANDNRGGLNGGPSLWIAITCSVVGWVLIAAGAFLLARAVT